MLIHREALELARNAGKVEDGVVYPVSCLHITPEGHVTVTDGHHFIRIKAAVDEPSLFDEIAAEETEALEEPVLIPAEVALAFGAAMKRRSKKGEDVPHVVVAAQAGAETITLRSSDGKTTRSFLIGGMDPTMQFPKVDRAVRGANAPVRHIVFDVDLVMRLLRVLKAVGATSVRFGLTEREDGPMSFSAFTEHGPVDGAVMPMKDR